MGRSLKKIEERIFFVCRDFEEQTACGFSKERPDWIGYVKRQFSAEAAADAHLSDRDGQPAFTEVVCRGQARFAWLDEQH